MPSCWLEAVVLLFGQTFGLAAEDVRPTLTAPTYQTVLRETLEAECQSLGDPDDWPSRARRGWRQLIVAHLKAADQDPAGDRLFALPPSDRCSIVTASEVQWNQSHPARGRFRRAFRFR